MSLADNQSVLLAVEWTAIVLALVIGGWLGWNALARASHTRVGIEHSVTHKRTFYRKTVLIVAISISNVGDVPVDLRSIKTYVRQLLPSPAGMRPAMLAFQAEDRGDGGMRLAPGETEDFSYTFFIDAAVQSVSISTHVLHAGRSILHAFGRRGQPAWVLTTRYDCASPAPPMDTARTFERATRIKVAVARYTATFPRGMVVSISNCEPDEPLEVLLFADGAQVHATRIAAGQNGQAHMSLQWQANAHGHVLVRSQARHDTAAAQF